MEFFLVQLVHYCTRGMEAQSTIAFHVFVAISSTSTFLQISVSQIPFLSLSHVPNLVHMGSFWLLRERKKHLFLLNSIHTTVHPSYWYVCTNIYVVTLSKGLQYSISINKDDDNGHLKSIPYLVFRTDALRTSRSTHIFVRTGTVLYTVAFKGPLALCICVC